MKTKESDFYYGAALSQISEYSTLTTVSAVKGKAGLFRINKDKYLLIKYATTGEGVWEFFIQNSDLLDYLRHEFYVALVCGSSTICLLTEHDISELVNNRSSELQRISVSFEGRMQMTVKGSKGKLKYKIPHNAFPKNMLDVAIEIYNKWTSEIETQHEHFYFWPPLCHFRLYETNPVFKLIYSSEDRKIDIVDILKDEIDLDDSVDIGCTVFFSISSLSSEYYCWNEKILSDLENQINLLFVCSDYNIDIIRLTKLPKASRPVKPIKCEKEFIWKLEISRAPADCCYSNDFGELVDDDEFEYEEIVEETHLSMASAMDDSQTLSSLEKDPLYDIILEFVLHTKKASPSAIQRNFSIDYDRAEKIVNYMEVGGVVGPMLSNGKRIFLL
jgi:hypothetical protein